MGRRPSAQEPEGLAERPTPASPEELKGSRLYPRRTSSAPFHMFFAESTTARLLS